MPRIINHSFLNEKFTVTGKRISKKEYEVIINRVGVLSFGAKIKITTLPPRSDSANPGTGTTREKTLQQITLIDPDGIPFTKNRVNMSDLDRYRDLLGFIKPWKLVIGAQTVQNSGNTLPGEVQVFLSVRETLPNISAPPLLNVQRPLNGIWEHKFDLYRIGELRVTATSASSNIRISLIRPDGTVKVLPKNNLLKAQITQPDIKYSRDSSGKKKLWTLRFEGNSSGRLTLYAQVYDKIKIPQDILLDRFNDLFGKDFENIVIRANWNGSLLTNVFTIKAKTRKLAEFFEMFISNLFEKEDDEPIKENKEYKVYEKELVLEENGPLVTGKIQAKCANIQNDFIKVEFGESKDRYAVKAENAYTKISNGEIMIPKGWPKMAVTASLKNSIRVIIDNWDNGEIVMPDLLFEMALSVNNGNIKANCWIDPHSAKWGGNEGNPHIPLYNDTYYLMSKISGAIDAAFNTIVTEKIQDIFDRMMGGIFTFTGAKWNKTAKAMEFEYITDKLPEPERNEKYESKYNQGLGLGGALTDETWNAPNLSNPDNIKHIVVLMMENRSFDHVSGYLSLPGVKGPLPMNSEVDGLTEQLLNTYKIPVPGYSEQKIQHLKNAGFEANEAGLKTKLDANVGHGLKDVEEQLDPDKTMKGFVSNFIKVNGIEVLKKKKIDPQDVLGYYTGEELSMYEFLAAEFAICDNYFCSHPGPTLPNRMFSLKGNLQRDRNGEPRMTNAVDSTFFLCRDQNIFDILSQQGVSWRVYESLPSVTMLRMFARYAGDNEKIKDIANLETDIESSTRPGTKKEFPSVVFIDPAMHDYPVNDDHPPADMLHGQHLVKRIYDALRSNADVWNHTLFVITYDEHGGFFDHVVPPVVETYRNPLVIGEPGSPRSNRTDHTDVFMGLRVPVFLVSPYVKKGSILKTKLDHTSILKSILARFCGAQKPYISQRVKYANSLERAITSEFREIKSEPGPLPSLPDNRSRARRSASTLNNNFDIMTKQKISGESADFHEFMSFLGRTVRPYK
jgi:phospholipase C